MTRKAMYFFVVTVVLAVLALELSCATANPYSKKRETRQSGEWTYWIDPVSKNASISGYKGTSTDLNIPSELDGIKVTSVSFYAPELKITSVKFPEGIRSISGFKNMLLTKLTLPQSLKQIGIEAFKGNQLSELTIPPNVETIQTSAFADNKILSVTIPAKTGSIDNAFNGNPITSVTFLGDGCKDTYTAFDDKWLGRAYALDKKAGTYERKAGSIYYNGQIAQLPAYLEIERPVVIIDFDGGGRWNMNPIIKPGPHIITVKYSDTQYAGNQYGGLSETTRSSDETTLTINLEGGKEYVIKAKLELNTASFFVEEVK